MKLLKVISKLFLLFLVLALPAAAEYAPGQLIVKFKAPIEVKISAVKSPDIRKIFFENNIQKVDKLFQDAVPQASKMKTMADGKTVETPDLSAIYILTVSKEANILELVRKFKLLPDVEYAEPNYIVRALIEPNDTYYSSRQWGMKKISAEAAWDITQGTSSTVIAVVDTGISYLHEDLYKQIRTDLGKNFVTPGASATDDNGHGSHVAGIIGAMTNNSTGVAGLNWNISLIPVKVLNASGNGQISDVVNGIIWAADKSAKVINLSIGGPDDSSTLHDAVKYAYNTKGALLVAAAGNSSTEAYEYPAAYSEVMAVAATDQNDKRSVWNITKGSASNYGAWVDISAPGTDIFSTYYPNTYTELDGTSMASPHVAGLAGLLLALDPTLTNDQIKSRILNSADSIDSLNPEFVGKLGSGRINVLRAMGFPVARITYPTSSAYISGTIGVTGTASSTNLVRYRLFVGTGANPSLYQKLTEGTSDITDGTIYNFNTAIKSDGVQSLKLICESATHLTSEASVTFTIDNTYPVTTISSPTAGQQIRGNVSIKGSATDTNFNYYTLSYAKDYTFTTITSSASQVASSTLGEWNTTGLTGKYILKLMAIDLASNVSETTLEVDILQNNNSQISASSTVRSTPNPFNPGTQTQTYIYYSLSENAPTAIYLFNIGGDLIWNRSYASGENGGKSGENLVPWDGKTPDGTLVDNGVYFYKIVALGAGKKVIGSGRIIVIR